MWAFHIIQGKKHDPLFFHRYGHNIVRADAYRLWLEKPGQNLGHLLPLGGDDIYVVRVQQKHAASFVHACASGMSAGRAIFCSFILDTAKWTLNVSITCVRERDSSRVSGFVWVFSWSTVVSVSLLKVIYTLLEYAFSWCGGWGGGICMVWILCLHLGFVPLSLNYLIYIYANDAFSYIKSSWS